MKNAIFVRAAFLLLLEHGLVASAQLPPTPTKAAGADYQTLVARGFPTSIARLLSGTTEVIARDEHQLHFVQTFPGGSKREVILKVTPAEDRGVKRALALESGDVVLSERTSVKMTASGYAVTMALFIPESALGSQTGNDADSYHRSAGGPSVPPESQPASGLSVTISDVTSGPSTGSGSGGTAGSNVATEVSNQVVNNWSNIKDIYDVVTAPPVNPGPPTTTGGKIASGLDAAGTVIQQGASIWGIGRKHWMMKDRLRALRKCAENPTNPLAKRAQREDPKYRESTTDVIDRAERDLDANSTIKIVATTANGIASTLLSSAGVTVGKQISKGVGVLDQIEQKLLDDVAEAYIMADAGKGVVPCEPDCDPVIMPAPPSEQLASYPPADLACSPSPEQLVCRAEPANSSQPTRRAQQPPAPGPTCGVVTRADFIWRKMVVTFGCGDVSCGFRSEQAFYAGSAVLKPRRGGYEGKGSGQYGETTHEEGELRISTPCKRSRSDGWVSGRGDLEVTAMFSINNAATGGLYVPGATKETSVVEIITNGTGLHDESHTFTDCEPPKSESIDNQVMGFDCHFYGVPLDRPGMYVTFKDHTDGASGVCTLILSK